MKTLLVNNDLTVEMELFPSQTPESAFSAIESFSWFFLEIMRISLSFEMKPVDLWAWLFRKHDTCSSTDEDIIHSKPSLQVEKAKNKLLLNAQNFIWGFCGN